MKKCRSKKDAENVIERYVGTVRHRGMGTGISESSKRVPIFSFATQGGKQLSSHFRQGNSVQARGSDPVMMMMAFIGTLNSNPHSHLSNRRILSCKHYVPARSALLKGTAPREANSSLGRRNNKEEKLK